MALSLLRRPSTLEEISEAVWRLFSLYATKIGCKVQRIRNPLEQVKSVVERGIKRQKLQSAVVKGVLYVWLIEEQWPSGEELAIMEKFRTVHQAVRCALNEIVASGEKYSGVFSQVKRIHEYVEKNTKFSKKQVR